jgi:hypothetical protein
MILERASDISATDGRRPRLDKISNYLFVVSSLIIQIMLSSNLLETDPPTWRNSPSRVVRTFVLLHTMDVLKMEIESLAERQEPAGSLS